MFFKLCTSYLEQKYCKDLLINECWSNINQAVHSFNIFFRGKNQNYQIVLPWASIIL